MTNLLKAIALGCLFFTLGGLFFLWLVRDSVFNVEEDLE